MKLTLKSLATAALLLTSLSQFSYAGVISGTDDSSSSTSSAMATTSAATTAAAPSSAGGSSSAASTPASSGSSATSTNAASTAASASSSKAASSTGSSTGSASSNSSATGSATASSASSSSSGNSSSSSSPQFVIYSDKSVSNVLPDVSDMEGYTVVALSFLLSSGAADQALAWSELDSSTRQSLKKSYNDAGIKIIVSAFGSTEEPTTSGLDATSTAQTMAKWVTEYDLDGIDVDYEDFAAMNAADGSAEKWLATFTKALRSTLTQGKYIVTHAPVAPWFDKDMYASGAYMTVHEDVGDEIDWYNVQFYNQGDYTTCDTLVGSSSKYPGSALKEIIANGVDQSKLLIGKPATSADATRDYVDPSTLATCLSQAKDDGWSGGVMVWQYPNADASWIKTVRASSWPVSS